MPLGEIKPRTVSAEERAVLDKLGTLKYPQHLDRIRHLPQEEFRLLMYAMNPRDALILAGYQDFREVLEYQKGKRWYHEVRDYVWRLRHGIK